MEKWMIVVIQHAASYSQISMETPTRAPEQANIVLVGSRYTGALTLSFSRIDSNRLGIRRIEWRDQGMECKRASMYPHLQCTPWRYSLALFFAGGTDIACMALSGAGSIDQL